MTLELRFWLMLPPWQQRQLLVQAVRSRASRPVTNKQGPGALYTRVARALPAWLHGGGESAQVRRALARRPLRKGIYTSAFSFTAMSSGFTMAGS